MAWIKTEALSTRVEIYASYFWSLNCAKVIRAFTVIRLAGLGSSNSTAALLCHLRKRKQRSLEVLTKSRAVFYPDLQDCLKNTGKIDSLGHAFNRFAGVYWGFFVLATFSGRPSSGTALQNGAPLPIMVRRAKPNGKRLHYPTPVQGQCGKTRRCLDGGARVLGDDGFAKALAALPAREQRRYNAVKVHGATAERRIPEARKRIWDEGMEAKLVVDIREPDGHKARKARADRSNGIKGVVLVSLTVDDDRGFLSECRNGEEIRELTSFS
ncbi:hypothetical protein B0J13DRAFT_638844 [Dactylonectria estremocensis]|uniref:Uncharacterized protein n=1 Tax=Dactylonectria estremocensis TaxID=1079267 RepID=A0A9P9ELT6_9HYPO|nr:hypothetical protein B0J13DRAFT_638844 [Dactylonectria estremocensis]